MKQDFDWRLIRSFLAALDQGSLLGAARALQSSQPTIGRHIAELESQLGVVLFERTGRGLLPSGVALRLADSARTMETGALQVARNVSLAQSGVSGTIRLTASQPVACVLLPPILSRMRVALPDVQVELVASNEISNLLRREADIAVRMVRPAQSSLVARKLGDIEIVAAAHSSYLAKAPPLRRAEDLLAHRLVGYDRDEVILRGFARMGVTLSRADFAVRTDDQVAYGRLVAEGAGIGFVAGYNLRHWPGVVAVLPMLKAPPLPCWLAVHREIRSNPLMRTVYDFLARELPACLVA